MKQKKSERVGDLLKKLKEVEDGIGSIQRDSPGWNRDLCQPKEYVANAISTLSRVQGEMESIEGVSDNMAERRRRFSVLAMDGRSL